MSITSNFCVILGWHMRAHSCLTSHACPLLSHLTRVCNTPPVCVVVVGAVGSAAVVFHQERGLLFQTRSNVQMENHHRRLIQRLESVRTTQSRCVCGIKRLLKSLKLSWVSSRLGKTKQFRLCCDGFFYVKMMMLHKHNVTTVNFVDYTEIKIKI